MSPLPFNILQQNIITCQNSSKRNVTFMLFHSSFPPLQPNYSGFFSFSCNQLHFLYFIHSFFHFSFYRFATALHYSLSVLSSLCIPLLMSVLYSAIYTQIYPQIYLLPTRYNSTFHFFVCEHMILTLSIFYVSSLYDLCWFGKSACD